MWTTLSSAPPPSCLTEGLPVLEAETNIVTNTKSDLVRLLNFHRIIETRPNIDPSTLLDPVGSKLIRTKSTNPAKSAFLSSSNTAHRAVATWYEGGWVAALGELSAYANRVDCNIFLRLSGTAACGFLNVWKSTFNFFGSFSKTKQCSDELISLNSSTRQWTTSIVRTVSWHPQVSKLAVALRDDTIHVVGASLQVSPVLRHKKQRGVTCLAWRPFMAGELAVGAATGIFIWNVDPSSVVARPSANCVYILPSPAGHAPVTGLSYHPDGKFLLSSSAQDQSIIVWCSASERHVAVKCINKITDGIRLALWSPQAGVAMAASTSSVFKLITTAGWTQERWNVQSGFVQTACWSSCGTTLLFASSDECQIFSLKFSVSENSVVSTAAADPVMETPKILYTLDDGEEVSAGGQIETMRWDPSNSRLVISFVGSPLLAVVSTKLNPTGISISPIGYIRGEADEVPSTFEFAKDTGTDLSILTIAWSSGRIQHFPFIYSGAPIPTCSDLSFQLNASDFKPVLFSSPAFD